MPDTQSLVEASNPFITAAAPSPSDPSQGLVSCLSSSSVQFPFSTRKSSATVSVARKVPASFIRQYTTKNSKNINKANNTLLFRIWGDIRRKIRRLFGSGQKMGGRGRAMRCGALWAAADGTYLKHTSGRTSLSLRITLCFFSSSDPTLVYVE